MDECQVCGKPIEQPARGYRRNCSDACRIKNAERNRRRFSRYTTPVVVRFDALQMRRLKKAAGEGHGAITRFVREAIRFAVACRL